MKVRVFQSDKGDCLLLTTDAGANILADGGMYDSFKESVRPHLGRMRRNGEVLDLVYVSHIDQDHIAGILQMVDDEMAWRRYNYHQSSSSGSSSVKKPKFPRPPKIEQVWHNAFHTYITKNRGRIEDLLAAMSFSLHLDPSEVSQAMAGRVENLVTSKREAVRLSSRLDASQLDIPLNESFGKQLAMPENADDNLTVGGAAVKVLGPSKKDLRKLRKDWDNWLREEGTKDWLKKHRKRNRKDADDLGNASDLALSSGNRGGVTIPNLASLMLHISDGGKSILLTGDGHAEDVMKGLKSHGLVRNDGTCHVNVLKIPHHGSTHNFEPKLDFFKNVTADHYVFCGNGANTNPEEEVVKLLLSSRIGSNSEKSKSAEVDDRFKLWFNASEEVVEKTKYAKHMKKIEDLVKQRHANHSSRFNYRFLKNRSMSFTI